MTTAHYSDESVRLYHGDCIEVMRQLPDASVDAVVTDPPYGLEFMGKEWDRPWAVSPTQGVGFTGREDNLTLPSFGDNRNANCRGCGGRQRGKKRCTCDVPDWDRKPGNDMAEFQAWCLTWTTELYRVMKPGAHLLAFGGTRTWHRLACAIEDAGFEVRDSIAWMYGSGFPKSLDVSKAMDKRRDEDLQPAADVARWLVDQLEARGLARKDVTEHFGAANIAQQWTTHWTDGAVKPRVPRWEQWLELKSWLTLPDDMDEEVWRLNGRKGKPGEGWTSREIVGQYDQPDPRLQGWAEMQGNERGTAKEKRGEPVTPLAQQWQGWGTALKPAFEPVVVARKPLVGTVAANVERYGTGALNIDGARIGTEERVNAPASSLGNGVNMDGGSAQRDREPTTAAGRWPANVILDESQAAELDRQSGVQRDGVAVNRNRTPDNDRATYSAYQFGQNRGADVTYGGEGGASRFFYTAKADSSERPRVDGVAHPTVKPLDLMRYLVRLVTPPGGVVLEPFAGSGTTLEACIVEGFRCIGIEREADYIPLIMARITKPIEVTLL